MKKYILILLLFLSCLTFAFEKNVTAKTNTITFSNKQWLYLSLLFNRKTSKEKYASCDRTWTSDF